MRASEQHWSRLRDSAAALHAAVPGGESPTSGGNARGRRAALVGIALAAAAGTALAAQHELTARADSTADQDLFSLTNQDRASNGLHALLWQSTLGAIGESKPYGGCGFNVNGRSYDMIQRNYFAHPILNCGGQLVFNMMSASGVNYRSAGENIGWTSGTGDAASSASYINQQFMNSTEHRANILDTSYTHLGIGSDLSPPGYTWTGTSPGLQNVWMFSEEFAQLASTAPAPTPKPAPPPTARPAPPPPTANSAPPPATTATPEATPEPTPTPIPAPFLGGPQPPLVWSGGGLVADSIESVLEAFLVD